MLNSRQQRLSLGDLPSCRDRGRIFVGKPRHLIDQRLQRDAYLLINDSIQHLEFAAYKPWLALIGKALQITLQPAKCRRDIAIFDLLQAA